MISMDEEILRSDYMATEAIVVHFPEERRSFALDIGKYKDEAPLKIMDYLEERIANKTTQVILVGGLENYGEYAVEKVYKSEADFMQRVFEEQLFEM